MADSECERGKIKVPASLGLGKTYSVKARLDEGCSSWTACVVGFIVMFIIGGQNNCSGIIFAVLLDEFNTNRGQTGKNSLFCFESKTFGPSSSHHITDTSWIACSMCMISARTDLVLVRIRHQYEGNEKKRQRKVVQVSVMFSLLIPF